MAYEQPVVPLQHGTTPQEIPCTHTKQLDRAYRASGEHYWDLVVARTWARWPWRPKRLRYSTGPLLVAPNQSGVRVSHSTASPAFSKRSWSPSNSLNVPLSTYAQPCPSCDRKSGTVSSLPLGSTNLYAWMPPGRRVNGMTTEPSPADNGRKSTLGSAVRGASTSESMVTP